MKAFVFYEHGDIDKVAISEVEKPSAKSGEVLIEVKASALNHLDIWTRN